MSDKVSFNKVKNSEEIPEKISSDTNQSKIEQLLKQLDLEKEKSIEYEEKFKHVLADFQNLEKKTYADIQNGINARIDEFVLDFLKIYDDFQRAKESFSDDKTSSDGLDSILKNMDALLKKYNIIPIDSLGQIFDPNIHEAISIVSDPDLDDNTITKEIRKGYISNERVIRSTLVEISKRE